jgi:hypothetical protein
MLHVFSSFNFVSLFYSIEPDTSLWLFHKISRKVYLLVFFDRLLYQHQLVEINW